MNQYRGIGGYVVQGFSVTVFVEVLNSVVLNKSNLKVGFQRTREHVVTLHIQ